jgi:hypothetical protein
MQHLSKGMLDLNGSEREPFLQGGEEQEIMDFTIMESQEGSFHNVSLSDNIS